MKRVQDILDEVKEEEPIQHFFINNNDIFDYDQISENDRLFIMDFIDRISFIAIMVKEPGGGKKRRVNSTLFL